MPNKNLTMNELGILREFDSLALTSTTPFHSECQCQAVELTQDAKLTHRQIFVWDGPFLDTSSSVRSCHGPLVSMLVSVP